MEAKDLATRSPNVLTVVPTVPWSTDASVLLSLDNLITPRPMLAPEGTGAIAHDLLLVAEPPPETSTNRDLILTKIK